MNAPLSARQKAVLALLAGGLMLLATRVLPVRALLLAATTRIAELGPWAPAAFVLLYVLASVCFVPGSLLTLGAGAVFGLARGFSIVWVGATLGAAAAFLLGRYAARDWIAAKVEKEPRFRALDRGVAREGFKIVLLTRLSPVFPFTLLNYAFGLTGVTAAQYLAGSAIGMVPGTLLYVYLGSLAGSLVGLQGGPASRSPYRWAVLALGLAATAAVAWYAARIAKQALSEGEKGPGS